MEQVPKNVNAGARKSKKKPNKSRENSQEQQRQQRPDDQGQHSNVVPPPPGFELPPPPGLPPPGLGESQDQKVPTDTRGGAGPHNKGRGGEGPRGGNRGGRNRGYQQPRDRPPKHRFHHGKSRNDHNGILFNGPAEVCILCCQPSDIFGVGQCRHPACMECVIRMRCFGDSKKCHACREDIPMMHFVRKPPDWKTFNLPPCQTPHPDLQKYQICFEDIYTADCYDKYNTFSCPICAAKGQFADFPTFPALKQHMGLHGLFFCHLCLDNLNILPKDYHTFNKHELNQHMSGERNLVDGVRGHPICTFCHQRFFDDEELYKHARKEHFFCSICAESSGKNSFFNRADQLHKHYRQQHHPCLHPECRDLGIVFANDFELNVHNTQQHGADRTFAMDFPISRGDSRFESTSRVGNQGVPINQARYGEPPPQLTHGVTVVPSNQPTRPAPNPVNIIPSAQATGRHVSLVQRPAIVQQHDFPSLSSTNSAQNAYSQSATWRAQIATARSQAQQRPVQSLGEQMASANHFPTLGSAPSTSSGSQHSAGIWHKGNAVEVIKKAPKEVKKPSPQPPRRRIIPMPEVWPENMRRKLEARELGLPEPPDLEPPLPQPPLDINDRKKKRDPKPKKKTVSFDALKQRLTEQSALSDEATSSKFSVLSMMD